MVCLYYRSHHHRVNAVQKTVGESKEISGMEAKDRRKESLIEVSFIMLFIMDVQVWMSATESELFYIEDLFLWNIQL